MITPEGFEVLDVTETKRTDHGFKFGAAEVSCMCSIESRGLSIIGIETPRVDLQVTITRTGFVRIHDSDGNEWKKES